MRVVANRAAETITADVPKRFSSLIIELPVQQTGSGDPSPENIRPIIQWADVKLYVADSDTAAEPTVTTTLPTPIFGGMVDVARGEVASLYNEKKSSSGWEMVEEGQFRCQVGAFNNGDETSTNVADLYSSHYKTVSNKDAYDATDDLTCGTPTIEGVTYLYVNDLDYSTLEAFTAYIGDVQFVYKSHVPMSDAIGPTIVYLPEGTSYVWAEGAFYTETVTGTPPLSLPNSVGEPLDAWSVELSPYQDLHGYDNPWPAGGGVNKFDASAVDVFTVDTMVNVKGHYYTDAGTYYMKAYGDSSRIDTYIYARVKNSDDSWGGTEYIVTNAGALSGKQITISSGQTLYVFDASVADSESAAIQKFVDWKLQVAVASSLPDRYYPYSNICPITGTDTLTIYTDSKYGGLVEWNQLVQNGNFADGTNNWAFNETWKSKEVVDGVLHLVSNSEQPAYLNLSQVCPNIVGHKYFASLQIKASKSSRVEAAIGSMSGGGVIFSNPYNADTWTFASGIGTPHTYTQNTLFVRPKSSTDTEEVDVYIKDIICCDLTQMFGAGNEPTTVEEFRSLFPNDYYDYNVGQQMTVDQVNGSSYTPAVITLPQTVYAGTIGSDDSESIFGIVDLGTLTWTNRSATLDGLWSTDRITDYIHANSIKAQCSAYKYVGVVGGAANVTVDGTCAFLYNSVSPTTSYFYIRDTTKGDLTAEEFKTAMSGVQLVYELATPTTLTLTTPTISTPRGNATAWATAEDGTVDSMEVQYTRIAEQ